MEEDRRLSAWWQACFEAFRSLLTEPLIWLIWGHHTDFLVDKVVSMR